MNEPRIFVLADRALEAVVAQIRDEQWSLAIPDWIALGNVDRAGLTLRKLVDYHAFDDVWVPDMLAGRTMAEVGVDKWKPDDLLGDEPKSTFSTIVEAAVAAAGAVTDEQLSQTAHLSFGDYTVQEYFWQISQFRAFRAYELAVLIGVDPTLPDELVQGVWDQLTPNVEEWRAIGVFGPAVEVPSGASLQDQLLGLSGRHPHPAR